MQNHKTYWHLTEMYKILGMNDLQLEMYLNWEMFTWSPAGKISDVLSDELAMLGLSSFFYHCL